jgi:DNA-binding transcriptional LysR family regulator
MKRDSRVRRRLKLRDLDTLAAVARHASMAKAAAHLAISQPAVSKAIAEMEQVLGVRLLDRSAQGVEPNLYGRALLKWATAVFDDIDQGVKEIEFLADPTKGELRVGATEPIVAGLLPAVLETLHAKHPQICIHIKQVVTSAELSQSLRERNFDLIVGRVAKPIADDIDAEILFHDPIFVVAGLKNRWTHRRKIALAELMNESWALPPLDSLLGSVVAGAFRANGLDVPRANVVTAALQLYPALIAKGYLAIWPGSMLHFNARHLGFKALPIDLPLHPWPVAIITLKNRTISPVAKLFIECTREAAGPLAKDQWNK